MISRAAWFRVQAFRAKEASEWRYFEGVGHSMDYEEGSDVS